MRCQSSITSDSDYSQLSGITPIISLTKSWFNSDFFYKFKYSWKKGSKGNSEKLKFEEMFPEKVVWNLSIISEF